MLSNHRVAKELGISQLHGVSYTKRPVMYNMQSVCGRMLGHFRSPPYPLSPLAEVCHDAICTKLQSALLKDASQLTVLFSVGWKDDS
jgi:hypothetical protein